MAFDFVSLTGIDEYGIVVQYFLGRFPAVEGTPVVCSDDEVKLFVRVDGRELAQGVDRIGRAGQPELEVGSVEGRDLWLGGILVPHTLGLLGHSDADVLIHAICDALLGAANMRDIGYHFPDSASEFENIDSKVLLRKTVGLIASKGYRIGNIDATVCAERPKLKNYIPQMQKVLAEVMNIDVDDVSIKATTTEKLGFTGREEGISAYAVVLISKD